jgi:signal transduction histidine kinase
MRLRTRYFLISWPLVVLAIAAVAFGVDRWTVVELDRIERAQRPARDRSNDAAIAGAVTAQWERRGTPPSRSELAALSGSDSLRPELAVIDSAGALLTTTDAGLALVSPPAAPGEIAKFARRVSTGGGGVTEAVLALDGLPLRSSTGRLLGALYVLPIPPEDGPQRSPESRASALRRRIWSVAAIAAFAAAVASLLLAGPLVTRVRTLADAAGDIQRGALDTRVSEAGSDELSQFASSFNAMTRAVAEARGNQQKLIGDVAHELRTPLTNIVGLIEAMQDGLHPRDDAALATVRREVGLLTSLVHELQELSLAESKAMRFDITGVDAVQVARDAVAAIAPSGANTRVIAPVEKVLVRADMRRLAQCLANLLRNAVAHTPQDGEVTVTVTQSGPVVTLAVEDTGVGIPAEHLALVFDRFHRVDASRARTSGGMGLGLAVVRELVTGMGGRVSAESEPGRGSRFVIELPAAS